MEHTGNIRKMEAFPEKVVQYFLPMEKQKINLSSDFLTHKKSTDTSQGLKNILDLEKIIIKNASKDIVVAPPYTALSSVRSTQACRDIDDKKYPAEFQIR